MKKRILDLAIMISGAIGAVVISILAIADHEATDMVSAIPIALVFCSMFIAGYVSASIAGGKK